MFSIITDQVKERKHESGKSACVKFIYSEKATNFCKISTLDLSYVVNIQIYSAQLSTSVLRGGTKVQKW